MAKRSPDLERLARISSVWPKSRPFGPAGGGVRKIGAQGREIGAEPRRSGALGDFGWPERNGAKRSGAKAIQNPPKRRPERRSEDFSTLSGDLEHHRSGRAKWTRFADKRSRSGAKRSRSGRSGRQTLEISSDLRFGRIPGVWPARYHTFGKNS